MEKIKIFGINNEGKRTEELSRVEVVLITEDNKEEIKMNIHLNTSTESKLRVGLLGEGAENIHILDINVVGGTF